MGVFDGGFKTIKGVKSPSKEDSFKPKGSRARGLFGFVAACMIKNVVLQDCSFSSSKIGYCMVGGIAAYVFPSPSGLRDSLITHNYVQGKLAVSDFSTLGHAGGIIGQIDFRGKGITISCNVVDIEISSDAGECTPSMFGVGGIVGANYGGTIVNNKVTGRISGRGSKEGKSSSCSRVGGVAGVHSGEISGQNADAEPAGSIDKNYVQGDLSTSNTAGGVVGGSGALVANNVSLCSRIDVIMTERGQFDIGRIVGKAWSDNKLFKNNYALATIKIDPASQWKLEEEPMTKDGESCSSPAGADLWKKAGFVFGKTPEAPWVVGKDKLPTLYWFTKVKKSGAVSIVVGNGSPLGKMQEQFLSRKELMEKVTLGALETLFAKDKMLYEQKLTLIIDNYAKQNKLEDSLPIQEMLQALKTAKTLSDLPVVTLPIPAEKEKKEFEKLLDTHSQALVSQKKAEYMAFKEKYIAARTRFKATLIEEKDFINALVVEKEINAMQVDTGESFEELAPSSW